MLSNANYRSGKTVEIEGRDECLKTMKREERLLDRGGGILKARSTPPPPHMSLKPAVRPAWQTHVSSSNPT